MGHRRRAAPSTLNALDAIEHGARVHVHTSVESVTRAPAGAEGGQIRHRWALTSSLGRRGARAHVIVNATGAWSPITASFGGLPQASVRVRPGKVVRIHVVLDRRLTNYGTVPEAIDGRQAMLEPWCRT